MIQKTIKIALEKDILWSSIKVTFVVGTILNLINQGDKLVQLNFEELALGKLLLTFMVPYLLSMYASIRVKMLP